jgi:hypothetical protein
LPRRKEETVGHIRVWIEGFLRGRYGYEGYRLFRLLAATVLIGAILLAGWLLIGPLLTIPRFSTEGPVVRNGVAVVVVCGDKQRGVEKEIMAVGKPHHPGEQMREEPLGVTQERALALHATQLLQERKRDELRVREPLEGLGASKMGVEESVGIVNEAEEYTYHFFQIGERGGMLRMGHLLLLVVGSLMAPFVLLNHATHI